MGGWARTAPTTYFVAWPDGVFKVGYSERQRWRRFLLRGARVARLVPFADFRDAFALEEQALAVLRRYAPDAFDMSVAAEGHLGCRGGGWLECVQLMPEQCDRICERISVCTSDSICDRIAAELCPGQSTDVTDLRTNYSPWENPSPNASPAKQAPQFHDQTPATTP